MKFKFLLLLSIFSFIISKAQKNDADLEVVYYFKIIPDSLNRSNFTESNMILRCNKNKSVYFSPAMASYYEYLKDYAQKIDPKNIDVNSLRPSIPKVRHNVWKEDNNVIATVPLGMYFYSFKEPELKWELLNEIKDIQGMKCQLAKVNTENDTFYAWYTSEIPFSDGPFRFKGLPGLILEVYNKNKTIEFSLASIKKSDKPIEKMERVSTIDLQAKKDFFRLREKWLQYPFNNIVNKDIEKRGLEEVKKLNVFLD
ncbi:MULTISPECIES: GLPGLI family protein [Chryseobacterium]|uniref:GLPGLI family protein n=1 Tax=Chryseobacterium gambrini TaxID=373672 RepID=A0A1N7LDH7_9FLAO|nr:MULTISPECIES: GLPGLI family protein [Chryseobacterium]SIS71841.1 GLPGLI family protein [Chryseobacterium gambrini]